MKTITFQRHGQPMVSLLKGWHPVAEFNKAFEHEGFNKPWSAQQIKLEWWSECLIGRNKGMWRPDIPGGGYAEQVTVAIWEQGPHVG